MDFRLAFKKRGPRWAPPQDALYERRYGTVKVCCKTIGQSIGTVVSVQGW
jgi:hypothetical protein